MDQGHPRLNRPAIGGAITVGLAAIIAILTLMPLPVSGPTGSDKVYHILAFACLALPLPFVKPRWTLWVILSVITYGGTIEALQPYFGRHAEWADLLADGLGALLGAGTGCALSVCWRSRLADSAPLSSMDKR